MMAGLLLCLAGCETVGWFGQAALGQSRILLARRPVAQVIDDPATPAALQARLLESRQMLAFAEHSLGLPVSGRYADYVELDREAVVWNLFATPRYSLTPVQWCFPIAGCVSYRGYFDEAAARRRAEQLAAEGHDVHVGPVAAYSTLGWFDDPLLSTFVGRRSSELAELLFHELAHGFAYVPSETAFNESFATFVGREGVRRWLAERGDEAALAAWSARVAVREQFVARALAARNLLEAGYREAQQAGLDAAALERRRARLWQRVADDWRADRPESLAPWDSFFLGPPSNARFSTVADYNAHVPAFAALLEDVDGDLRAFLERVRTLAEGPAQARTAFLAASGTATEAMSRVQFRARPQQAGNRFADAQTSR